VIQQRQGATLQNTKLVLTSAASATCQLKKAFKTGRQDFQNFSGIAQPCPFKAVAKAIIFSRSRLLLMN